MSRFFRRSALCLTLSTAVLAACQAADPAAIGGPAEAPAMSRTQPTTHTAPSQADLEDLLAQEEARIAARQEAEQAVYDSLAPLWQAVLDDTTGRYADSLMCDPKQYVATAKIVGPEGADIDFGEHKLRIPAGALSVPTVITAEAPTSLRVTAFFSPHGTRFNPDHRPTLALSYKHCRGPVGRAARIAYVGPGGEILEWPPSQDFPEDAIVTARIEHFSNYIVAY